MKKILVVFIILLCSKALFAQRIQVNTSQTPTQLIENVLLKSGVCGGVTNVHTSPGVATTGANSPFGSYTQNSTNNLFTQGMIISTGFASHSGNTTINTILSDNIGTNGDTDLANAFSVIAPAVLSDAAYIEFDFTPIKPTLSFRYFLASEEYENNKNYPCKFSDAFAFLIKDVTSGSNYQNIALIPGTTIPVGISTVRPDLTALTGGCPASYPNYFNGYNQNPPNVDGSNFNGSTKAFTASSTVIPGHTYHIKLVIADYGSTAVNKLYDSAVFLEAGSFDLSGFITDTNNVVISGSTNACTLVAHSQILNPVYQWYHNGVAIQAPQGTAVTYSVPIGDSGAYSVVVIDSVTSCTDTIAPVTVTALTQPTATSPQTLCVGSTLASLTATGSNLNWYATATGGTPLASTTVLTSGTYYVSQTVALCESIRTLVQVVIGNPTPTFNPIPAICSGGVLNTLPTTSINGIVGSWAPALNNTATTTYTFTPNVGQCGTTTTLTITVNPTVTPTFTAVNPICSGDTIATLPLTSIELITGSWSPALNNTTTTTYTFTPNAGQCGLSTTLTITVNALPMLQLASSASSTNQTVCSNTPIVPIVYTFGGIATSATVIGLPIGVTASSTNNTLTITGTPTTAVGSPFNYTITTSGGSCGTLYLNGSITVNPNIVPTFTQIPVFCSGSTAPVLPTTSLENISGTWSPATINNLTSQQYTFTPATTGACVTNCTISITVQNNFDFNIKGHCDGTNFVLDIDPIANFNIDTSTINWQTNGASIGNTTPTLNATQYVHSSQPAISLPVTFDVTITDNANCSRTHSYTVTDLYCDIQKGISPNPTPDGKNDFFDLINLDVQNLNIFNRYGVKVYSKAQYTNEWRGQTDSGSELPDGTYYYVIEFNNHSETKTGWIYINREH
ncbi:MAG: choice-of-anchor L domain-containing protein [Flavobacterium sp.]